MRVRAVVLLITVALATAVAGPASSADVQPGVATGTHAPALADPTLPPSAFDRLSIYGGLGTWTDIYDDLTYERPVAAVKAMHAQGVRTLYLETANYRIDKPIFRPRVVGRMVEAAHRRGIKVIAWYLPSFTNVDRDYRRSMAAINYTTRNGHHFDGFAMDIESDVVRDLKLRNARMRRLSQRVRASVGPDYPLGAIVPEAGARYWPDFPYDTVAQHYDIFLPMAYYTFRTSGAVGVDRWIRRNITTIRRETGNPSVAIHIIGGLARDTTIPELRGFVDAVLARNVYGASLYEFETTTPRQWRVLQRLR